LDALRVVEAAATVFGVACVAFAVRQSPWTWPTGLATVSLYLFVFLEVRLYSGAALQAVYVALNAYGWWAWLRGGESGGALPVSRLSREALGRWALVGAAGALALGFAMARFTDADLPHADATVTSFSLVGQWLMARKRVENWLFWIGVNVLAVFLYAAKDLWLSSGLYALFLALAISGWFSWKRAAGAVSD
jgi:nicotinamide mononucleotide transporter